LKSRILNFKFFYRIFYRLCYHKALQFQNPIKLPAERQEVSKMKTATLTFRVMCVMVFVPCLLSTSQAQTASQGQPEPPKIVRKAGGVLQGSATKRVTPTYPALAKEARVSGIVVVEVTVDEEGAVISARAVTGHPLLRDAAVDAARGWMFTPTRLNGVPVKVVGTITFNFTPPRDPAVVQEAENIKEQLRAKPGSADLYLKLGEVFSKLGDYRDAAEAYRQAVRFDEKLIPARAGLIRAYVALGDKDAAMSEHAKLKELDPEAAEEILKEIEK
jgi:TonB family protein